MTAYFPGYPAAAYPTPPYPAAPRTLLQILQGTESDEPHRLGRNLVAALLNALSGKLSASIINQTQLNTIWNTLGSSPTATWVVGATGQSWNAQQTNDLWFATLFPKAV